MTISPIVQLVKKRVEISDRDIACLENCFVAVKKQKGELLTCAGDRCDKLYVLVNGYIRSFEVGKDEEVTTNIFSVGDFVASFESFTTGEPSKSGVQCITDCELLVITKADHSRLYQQVSNWTRFCRIVYEEYIFKLSKRINILQNLSASERYLELLRDSPNIALHTPVKYLASYLGIKPQSLSRIRAAIK